MKQLHVTEGVSDLLKICTLFTRERQGDLLFRLLNAECNRLGLADTVGKLAPVTQPTTPESGPTAVEELQHLIQFRFAELVQLGEMTSTFVCGNTEKIRDTFKLDLEEEVSVRSLASKLTRLARDPLSGVTCDFRKSGKDTIWRVTLLDETPVATTVQQTPQEPAQ